MPQTRNVAVLVDSLRRESLNRKTARALVANHITSFVRRVEVHQA